MVFQQPGYSPLQHIAPLRIPEMKTSDVLIHECYDVIFIHAKMMHQPANNLLIIGYAGPTHGSIRILKQFSHIFACLHS